MLSKSLVKRQKITINHTKNGELHFGKTVSKPWWAVSRRVKALFCRCCCNNPIFPLSYYLRIIDKFSSNNNLNKLVLDHL